jgi:hypothetical protein
MKIYVETERMFLPLACYARDHRCWLPGNPSAVP